MKWHRGAKGDKGSLGGGWICIMGPRTIVLVHIAIILMKLSDESFRIQAGVSIKPKSIFMLLSF